jgi:GNAT superfamily N-acetyltransferase
MQKEDGIKIRQLSEGDLPSVMRLKELAEWNQTEGDWQRLLHFGPQGCFAACLRGRLIGTVTTATYGTDLAWIGMMLVDPDFRRLGIGTTLMKAALEYLRGIGVVSIKLDATAAGRPLYESLGFLAEGLIERWEGVALLVEKKHMAIFDGPAYPAVYSLDLQVFGADRRQWLDSLIAGSPVVPQMVMRSDGRLKGYGLMRPGSKAFYVGPVIAMDKEAALSLFDGLLSQLPGEKVYLDFNTGFGRGPEMLAKRGFKKQRDLIRMRLGREIKAGTSNLIFGIAGPEMG